MCNKFRFVWSQILIGAVQSICMARRNYEGNLFTLLHACRTENCKLYPNYHKNEQNDFVRFLFFKTRLKAMDSIVL